MENINKNRNKLESNAEMLLDCDSLTILRDKFRAIQRQDMLGIGLNPP